MAPNRSPNNVRYRRDVAVGRLEGTPGQILKYLRIYCKDRRDSARRLSNTVRGALPGLLLPSEVDQPHATRFLRRAGVRGRLVGSSVRRAGESTMTVLFARYRWGARRGPVLFIFQPSFFAVRST